MLVAAALACSSGPSGIDEALADVRLRFDTPAIGLALIGPEAVDLAVVGVRRAGSPDPVAETDAWHLGSNTKAMTATLFARLVEEGRLQWDTPLAEAFPDLVIEPQLRRVTLAALLDHLGGLTPLTDDRSRELDALLLGPDPRARRAAFTTWLLARPPTSPPGQFAYSNAGYLVLSAAIEHATGEAYEDLLRSRVWEPLGMDACGFGPPARERAGPWGHAVDASGARSPVAPDAPGADNPAAIAPAGTASCPLADWARFAAAHLAEDPSFLSAASWTRLHVPTADSGYVGGWSVMTRRWSAGPVWTHGGTNTMFTSTAWLAPTERIGVLGVCNAASDADRRALDEAVAAAVHSLPVR